jgi:hypothetical protein
MLPAKYPHAEVDLGQARGDAYFLTVLLNKDCFSYGFHRIACECAEYYFDDESFEGAIRPRTVIMG